MNKTEIHIDVLAADTGVVSIPVSSVSSNAPLVDELAINVPGKSRKLLDFIHSHSIVSFAILLLAIAVVSKPIVLDKFGNNSLPKLVPLAKKSSIVGLNISLNKSDYTSWLNQFLSQPAEINLGNQTAPVNQNIMRSWITATASADKSIIGVHLNTTLVKASLTNLANKYTSKPVDQIVATRSDGSSEIAVGGRNGFNLSDPTGVSAQAAQISKNLFSNKGFQINAPLVTVPFQSVTPASFNKMILVDVNSKKMYVYQNGQIVNTFLVSAGATATPTPIGEFHIYEKLPLQDMKGTNPNGTPYFQPNVEWVNYFSGADAIHGVYWHPLSWFGVHNSSHGCVGIPDNEAEWVYNWAPIGTTVITTLN